RPRRAAIARGATAPQQYATALHKVQGLFDDFSVHIRLTALTASKTTYLVFFKQYHRHEYPFGSLPGPLAHPCFHALELVIEPGHPKFTPLCRERFDVQIIAAGRPCMDRANVNGLRYARTRGPQGTTS